MSCINKNLGEWKALEKRYGEFEAELIIRGHKENRYINPKSDDFYIPSIRETSNLLKSQVPAAAKRKVIDKLSVNEFLSEDGIASLLTGFISKQSKYNDEYVINVGDKNGNKFARKDIYDANVNLLKDLEGLYPEIFRLEKTYDDNTFKVFISAKLEETQKELFEEKSLSMQDVIDKFNYLTKLKGYQPEVFDIGNQRWIQSSNNLYNLINKDTGTYIHNNINLQTGVDEQTSTPLDIENNNIAIKEVEALSEQEGFSMMLALNGYNIDLILRNMKEATTQEEFDIEYTKVKKFYCR
tara:strand:+ start:257 stop:1147 length:891 start_codon:yes stop_codon:yes gene_type:complete